tara:strand:+ start:1311 stop:1892 length:582 start_codon:yes stop_codon:yes gene_type:complete
MAGKIHRFAESLNKEKGHQKIGEEMINGLNEYMEKNGKNERFSINERYDNFEQYKKQQLEGQDVSIVMTNNETGDEKYITVDFKYRFPNWEGRSYDDFLAEIVSVDISNKPGWAVDKSKTNDLILYAITGKRKGILVHRKDLNRAFENKLFFKAPVKSAQNEGYNGKKYKTHNVVITIPELKKCCPTTIVFDY